MIPFSLSMPDLLLELSCFSNHLLYIGIVFVIIWVLSYFSLLKIVAIPSISKVNDVSEKTANINLSADGELEDKLNSYSKKSTLITHSELIQMVDSCLIQSNKYLGLLVYCWLCAVVFDRKLDANYIYTTLCNYFFKLPFNLRLNEFKTLILSLNLLFKNVMRPINFIDGSATVLIKTAPQEGSTNSFFALVNFLFVLLIGPNNLISDNIVLNCLQEIEKTKSFIPLQSKAVLILEQLKTKQKNLCGFLAFILSIIVFLIVSLVFPNVLSIPSEGCSFSANSKAHNINKSNFPVSFLAVNDSFEFDKKLHIPLAAMKVPLPSLPGRPSLGRSTSRQRLKPLAAFVEKDIKPKATVILVEEGSNISKIIQASYTKSSTVPEYETIGPEILNNDWQISE